MGLHNSAVSTADVEWADVPIYDLRIERAAALHNMVPSIRNRNRSRKIITFVRVRKVPALNLGLETGYPA
jgi:hypothetical protein